VIVLFIVLGAVLAVFARTLTAWSLRWGFSAQQLAERNRPSHERLRLFYRLCVAGHIGLGLFFFVAGVVTLLT
jgi:hypothetical protein